VIGDYNYLFDPNVYLKRYFAEGSKGEYIFLIDEAHNLVDRAREMYSASLYKEDFLAMKKLFKEHSRKVTQNLSQCNRRLLELKRQCEEYEVLSEINGLAAQLMSLGAALDEFLQQPMELPQSQEIMDFYLALRHFLNMYERLDKNYVVYCQQEREGRFLIKLFCVDTAVNLQQCLNKGRSTIFFSATLLPIQYYKDLLSTKEDNYAIYTASVFLPRQRLLIVGKDVSSKYTRRNEREFSRLAAYIVTAVQEKPGNYLAFFPSYKMLEQVLEKFNEINQIELTCLVQQPGMDELEREAFLAEFKETRQQSLIGFCVMGGIFAEGIDLKGKRLIGTIIVGTGIPQLTCERAILSEFYEQRCGQGFDYAYRYPGMNKVQQAAGRVIRTATDQGVILLLDERLLHRDYINLFPREWNDFKVCSVSTIKKQLSEFWEEVENEGNTCQEKTLDTTSKL
jgi:Rad3-related DNA helicase